MNVFLIKMIGAMTTVLKRKNEWREQVEDELKETRIRMEGKEMAKKAREVTEEQIEKW